MEWLRIGDVLVNFRNVTHIELDITVQYYDKSKHDFVFKQNSVRFWFNVTSSDGTNTLEFVDDEAVELRRMLISVGR